jgi:hypothetical protein
MAIRRLNLVSGLSIPQTQNPFRKGKDNIQAALIYPKSAGIARQAGRNIKRGFCLREWCRNKKGGD